jgi:DNA-binding response OmpR family regulator
MINGNGNNGQKRQSVLVVDDESNIRLMLRTTLQSSGYRVIEAGNGREALEAIDRDLPDVMILDLSMPVLDGMGLLRELAGRPTSQYRPRIIVLTAYGSIAAAVKATRFGAMDFLEKPVSPDEVRQSVEAVLNEVPPAAVSTLADVPSFVGGGYASALESIRRALRACRFTEAESLLTKAADLSGKDAVYLNLLGACCEMQHQWRLARKYYGKAIAADGHYQAAQQNMRRLYELNTFGASRIPMALGDGADQLDPRLLVGHRPN